MADFPSWNRCAFLDELLNFISAISDTSSPDYVPESARIACFDNDGTLWCEQPLPIQVYFAFDRIRQLAASDSILAARKDVQLLLSKDLDGLMALDKEKLIRLILLANQTDDVADFPALVREWFAHARHPALDRPFSSLAYRPMIELVDYLHAHDFRVFINTAGSVEFVRAISQEFYGILPERVIGSRPELEIARADHGNIVRQQDRIALYNDHASKIISAEMFLGQAPVVCIGNSDGDIELMQYAAAKHARSICSLLHHTDAEREYAYDEHAISGKLTTGMVVARQHKWPLIDMKQDFRTVFE
ncbi:MAG: HAD family hydrolase [Sphingomonadaceae bacterium]